jgi:hypothetical protein
MIINQVLTILFLPYFFFQSFSFNFNLWRNKDRNFWLALTNKDSLYSWPYFSFVNGKRIAVESNH